MRQRPGDPTPPASAASDVAPKAFPLLALIIKPLLAQAGTELVDYKPREVIEQTFRLQHDLATL